MMKEFNGHHNGHSHGTQSTTGQSEETGKTSRYSDEELEEFRQNLVVKLDKAYKDLELLRLTSTTVNEHDTTDTSRTFIGIDSGRDAYSNEENEKLINRQVKFIEALQSAFVRIEDKSYGICRKSGKLIEKARLVIVPHATLSVDAKNKSGQAEKQQKVFSNQPWIKH